MENYISSNNPFIFGFDDFIDVFKTRCVRGTMPQSILLHGPKGIGKATFAYHLARYLVQGQPENFNVPENSSLFAQVSQGACEYLMVLDRHTKGQEKKTRTISIDSVRQIVQFLQSTARNDRWRVVIIDSVDELHYKAANALLKTLEEPPRKTLVILISHSLGRVLPTLKSRCLLFGKTFLSDVAMTQAFKHLLPSMSMTEQDLYQVYAMGCPGRMTSFMTLGGRQFYQEFLKIMTSVIKDDVRPAISFVDKMPTQENPELFYEAFQQFFIWWLGHFLISSHQKLLGQTEETKIINQFQQKHKQLFWLNFWQHTVQLLAQTEEISLDRRAVLMSLFYTMAYGEV
ncbi:MAG: AAA family ATPase [Janthinobacterium lividum]